MTFSNIQIIGKVTMTQVLNGSTQRVIHSSNVVGAFFNEATNLTSFINVPGINSRPKARTMEKINNNVSRSSSRQAMRMIGLASTAK